MWSAAVFAPALPGRNCMASSSEVLSHHTPGGSRSPRTTSAQQGVMSAHHLHTNRERLSTDRLVRCWRSAAGFGFSVCSSSAEDYPRDSTLTHEEPIFGLG